MPHNLRTLKHVLKSVDADFKAYLRASTETARSRLGRLLWRKQRKAVKLVEELSPRVEMLERWTDEPGRASFGEHVRAAVAELAGSISASGSAELTP